ncbi:MAG: hypothetical protein KDD19_12495 [Phaeodactylibacter sp.]|nr:hypothetical protein [Phaeodactylibacter sp.]MCB9052980.1 hypothetical protein [Lewinellaceae bacterium]
MFQDISPILIIIGIFPRVKPFSIFHNFILPIEDFNTIGVKKKLSIGITNAGICNVEIHIPEFIINIRRATIKIYNRTGKAGIRLAVFTE